MSTILTAAGESLIARLQAEGKALIIDTMILANVPGQDHTQAIAPGVTVPAEAQIALRYAIPPQYRAYVNPNQVVYSAMLGSDMGDFTFNWQGLWCSEHNTLVAVATFPALEKRRYDEANGKTGNNLTRNFLLTFTGARELTGLTISADVWQLDFTVRLNGIDERQRLANFDIYGQAFFDADGWLLQKTAEAYAFAPGLGYVGGIRAALAESLPLAAPESANLPQNVWLDVCLKHTGSDRVAEASPMLTPPAAPLADSAADETGLMHYRALVARIEADGTVTDLRPRKTSGALPIPDVATPEVAGTMRPDGITCHMQEELLKVYTATANRAGVGRPDDKTLVISDGIYALNGRLVSTLKEFSVSQEFTIPEGVNRLFYAVTGAGGGGSSTSNQNECGAGGAGETRFGTLSVTPGETLSIVVGAHGVGAVVQNVQANGGDGGSSRIMRGGVILVEASGGKGGKSGIDPWYGQGGEGGQSGTGGISIAGRRGGDSADYFNNVVSGGGKIIMNDGGDSIWSAGGRGAIAWNGSTPKKTAAQPGKKGSGGGSGAHNMVSDAMVTTGANGGDGYILLAY